MVGRVGIEPTTGRLKAECSTSELTPPQISGYAGQDTGRDDTKTCRNDKGSGYRGSGPAPTGNLTRVSRVGTRSNRLVTLFVHSFQALLGQPRRGGIRVIALYPGQC